jgi:HPt (histidine-containing phosphotransfer) domain-containing protein
MSEHETEIVLDDTHFRRIISESSSEDTANQLADAFSTQVAQIVDELNDLLNSGGTAEQAARGLLHRLRGSAEILGARRLSHIIRSVLENNQDSFYSALRSALPSLHETIEDTLTEIRKMAG